MRVGRPHTSTCAHAHTHATIRAAVWRRKIKPKYSGARGSLRFVKIPFRSRSHTGSVRFRCPPRPARPPPRGARPGDLVSPQRLAGAPALESPLLSSGAAERAGARPGAAQLPRGGLGFEASPAPQSLPWGALRLLSLFPKETTGVRRCEQGGCCGPEESPEEPRGVQGNREGSSGAGPAGWADPRSAMRPPGQARLGGQRWEADGRRGLQQGLGGPWGRPSGDLNSGQPRGTPRGGRNPQGLGALSQPPGCPAWP